MKATRSRHTGGGLVRQSKRLAVPRDADIEICDRQANVVDPRRLHPALLRVGRTSG